MEEGARCVDEEAGVVHVVQQLRFHKVQYGGFYLAPPKSGSVGDVDLDDAVSAAYAAHIRDFPPVAVDLVDITRVAGSRHVPLAAALLRHIADCVRGGSGRCAESPTPRHPADDFGDLRPLVAEEEPASKHHRFGPRECPSGWALMTRTHPGLCPFCAG
jgi:hypothetical protein